MDRQSFLAFDTSIEIQGAAHQLHKIYQNKEFKTRTSLLAATVSQILGRKCPATTSGSTFCCFADSDAVMHGLKTVWKTGGKKVCDFVIKSVTADQLDLIDYAHEVTCRSHRQKEGQSDHESEQLETAYRWGERLPELERLNIVLNMERRVGSLKQKKLLPKYLLTAPRISSADSKIAIPVFTLWQAEIIVSESAEEGIAEVIHYKQGIVKRFIKKPDNHSPTNFLVLPYNS
ncbi:MAG: hypothetical protein WBB28_01910 [Crinalium sp.]